MKTSIDEIRADWENIVYPMINDSLIEEEQAKKNIKLSAEEIENRIDLDVIDNFKLVDGFYEEIEDPNPLTSEEVKEQDNYNFYLQQQEVEKELQNLFYEFERKAELENLESAKQFLLKNINEIEGISIKKKDAIIFAKYGFCKYLLEHLFIVKTTNSNVGFKLPYTEEQLIQLCQKFKDDGFLDSSTNEKIFINAFNGEVLNTDFKKLIWKKNKVNLSMFIGLLEQEHRWKTAEIVFENINSDNLRKTYNSQRELDKHKSTNNTFHKILDGLRAV
nr:hypothetical protein [uncultured Emticicia sp.]